MEKENDRIKKENTWLGTANQMIQEELKKIKNRVENLDKENNKITTGLEMDLGDMNSQKKV